MSSFIKICVVGEWLRGLPDEGIHNLSQNLAREWQKDNLVRMIEIGSDLHANRFFLSWKLRNSIRTIRPDLIFYISPASGKIAAFLRARVLKMYASFARVMIIAVQPVDYKLIEKWVLPLLKPDGIFVQSIRSRDLLQGIACPVYFLPSGVDLERFTPINASQKTALRKRYGVDEKANLVLHVGHIGHSRNIRLLTHLAQLRGIQVLLVGSTKTPQDEALIDHLSSQGVRIIREFVPHVEELYQLSDIYLFPVISEHASIGVPLSVLEAMACNIPVITTRFGGLCYLFSQDQGLFYFEDENELPELVNQALTLPKCSTRDKVRNYSWSKVAVDILKAIQQEAPEWN